MHVYLKCSKQFAFSQISEFVMFVYGAYHFCKQTECGINSSEVQFNYFIPSVRLNFIVWGRISLISYCRSTLILVGDLKTLHGKQEPPMCSINSSTPISKEERNGGDMDALLHDLQTRKVCLTQDDLRNKLTMAKKRMSISNLTNKER